MYIPVFSRRGRQWHPSRFRLVRVIGFPPPAATYCCSVLYLEMRRENNNKKRTDGWMDGWMDGWIFEYESQHAAHATLYTGSIERSRLILVACLPTAVSLLRSVTCCRSMCYLRTYAFFFFFSDWCMSANEAKGSGQG